MVQKNNYDRVLTDSSEIVSITKRAYLAKIPERKQNGNVFFYKTLLNYDSAFTSVSKRGKKSLTFPPNATIISAFWTLKRNFYVYGSFATKSRLKFHKIWTNFCLLERFFIKYLEFRFKFRFSRQIDTV